ncbi:myrosinase 1-like [Leptopilina boulardi]|uniref:myrosinase 1-like n=1 Tax=Leptopilina boulardi TaxID=63433 RepID=UPI0021F53FC9|nr:myrosinase 1-like [Leptopilina boulardi]
MMIIKHFTSSWLITIVFLISVHKIRIRCQDDKNLKFPKGFQIGAATAAHQIEGAWNISDKSESVWDHFSHKPNSPIDDKSTADVACNSYNLYKNDVKLLKNIGFDFYRFSISWARILPNGFANYISKDGIKYYNDLLDELHSKGIKPYVTIYHWDHPQALQKLGGWTNELMVQWFTDYARVVFKEFGPKIKVFFTINEPFILCSLGHGYGVHAPGINLPGIAEYICGHNVLKAHASAYHLYNNEFRKKQKGTIGIVNMCNSYFAKNKDPKLEDDAFQFTCGWFSHPIFSKKGDYPPIMKKLIKEISLRKGWSKSTLPVFDKKWINYIKGSSDFYGLNHYSSEVVERKINNGSYIWAEFNASFTLDPKWKMANSLWLAVVPEGFRKILKKIKKEYGNIPIYITENGYSDDGELMDEKRVKFYFLYLKEMLKAIYKDGCNVQLYTAWSLLDNFEWNRGYKEKFGIIQVDFDKPSRNRTMKSSAIWFKSLLQHRKLSLNYN